MGFQGGWLHSFVRRPAFGIDPADERNLREIGLFSVSLSFHSPFPSSKLPATYITPAHTLTDAGLRFRVL